MVLQYDRAVPHDGLGPGGPALRGGTGAALLPVPFQVSGPLGADSDLWALGCLLVSIRDRHPNTGLFFDLGELSPDESVQP